jgi:hypothetical protein
LCRLISRLSLGADASLPLVKSQKKKSKNKN